MIYYLWVTLFILLPQKNVYCSSCNLKIPPDLSRPILTSGEYLRCRVALLISGFSFLQEKIVAVAFMRPTWFDFPATLVAFPSPSMNTNNFTLKSMVKEKKRTPDMKVGRYGNCSVRRFCRTKETYTFYLFRFTTPVIPCPSMTINNFTIKSMVKGIGCPLVGG